MQLLKQHLDSSLRPLDPMSLRRIASTSSASSSTPGTPGGAEVGSILRARGRLPIGREAYRKPGREAGREAACEAGSAAAAGAAREVRTTTPQPEVVALVHAFHCADEDCKVDKCVELRAVIERIEAHVEWVEYSGRTSDMGVDMAEGKASCGGVGAGCRTCKLWRTLAKTKPAAVVDSAA
mgnify:CR=1 FL=1